jgi:hypothetical protein
MKKTILVILIICGIFNTIFAQKEKIQASYIYQFTKLIAWLPEYKTGDFVIGVLGEASLTKEIEAYKGKPVANQAITVKTYKTVDEIDKCNILYIPPAYSNLLTLVKKKVGKKCTLIITEKAGLIEKSCINFTEESGKYVFEINKTNIAQQKLAVSSKLISMAKKVYVTEDN